METKTGKRIVSKGKYVAVQSARTLLSLTGGTFLFLTLPFGFMVAVSGVMAFKFAFPTYNDPRMLNYCLWSLLAGFMSAILTYASWRAGTAVRNQSASMNNVVPLTRANTADLPAPDSLVRASSEPLQEQEAVLLRAAAEGQETPPEQLVRASVGQE